MSRVDLPAWAEPLLLEKARYRNIRGGRAGGKSWAVATALLVKGAQSKHRILCTREFQNSIRDSVHRLLSDRIASMGLDDFYTVTQNEIRGRNGTEFLFSGLRQNIQSVKSTEGITIAWVEEAQCISEASWEILVPTIRAAGSEIVLTWNPDQDTDPTYKRFVTEPPPDCWSIEVNWDQNPWLSDAVVREKDYSYRVDPESAAHVWGGRTRRVTNAQVLRGRYRVEPFEPLKDWHGPYFGADFGFSVDPTALVKCWVYERKLYVEYEAYAVGCDIDDTPALFDTVPGAKEHTIRADSSRPETISYLRRNGYARMLSVQKGSGSVEDGVEHLRSYEAIIIHPRCPHVADEARLWSYKVDRLTGDVLPKLDDKHDHLIDALRYALSPIIRAGKPLEPLPPKKTGPKDYVDRSAPSGSWKVV
jgi:phage terminase large subunit